MTGDTAAADATCAVNGRSIDTFKALIAVTRRYCDPVNLMNDPTVIPVVAVTGITVAPTAASAVVVV
ncbi:hypothetical protein, partial [Staphylococcus aureus]|uniref:hypothetical protein n=1 Tax=Staphylococcus aureus TaxID=1280 RepID=UPI0020BE8CA4